MGRKQVIMALKPLPPMPRGPRPKPQGWGGTEAGRWYEAEGSTQVGGTCCRCYDRVEAKKLYWRQGPFGRWAGWVCDECDKEPRQRWPRAATKRRKR